jgi:opacity protein-like surface antigen
MAGGAGVTGQFRGSVSSGVAVGPEAQFSLSPGWLALRVDVLYLAVANYHSPCLNSCIFVQEDVNTQVVSGDFSVVARLNTHDARWSPYVIAGVTTHYVSDPLKTAVRSNPLGWQGGLGIEVRSSKHVFFAEMRYMTIAPGGVVPGVVGMRF